MEGGRGVGIVVEDGEEEEIRVKVEDEKCEYWSVRWNDSEGGVRGAREQVVDHKKEGKNTWKKKQGKERTREGLNMEEV